MGPGPGPDGGRGAKIEIVTTILAFLFVLGVLVFVHELGHFLAARYFGVKVESFSIGFGRGIVNGNVHLYLVRSPNRIRKILPIWIGLNAPNKNGFLREHNSVESILIMRGLRSPIFHHAPLRNENG